MMSKLHPKQLGGAAGLILLLSAALPAQAVVVTTGCAGATFCTLTELYAGGTIAINDVRFDAWTFNFEGGGPIDPGDVTVTGVNEVPVSGDPTKATVGLDFDINPALSFDFLEYDFDFTASMVATTRVLTGAGLGLTNFNVSGNAFVEVNSDLTPGGLLSVDNNDPFANTGFAGTASIAVDADIQMEEFDALGSASLSGFAYRFVVMQTAQPAPEPSTLLLLGIAALVGGAARYRSAT